MKDASQKTRCGDRREIRSVRPLDSTRHVILALEEFQSLGVDFISLNGSIDTSKAMGKTVFTVLGAVAELERNIIRERVTAGLRRAKKEGKNTWPALSDRRSRESSTAAWAR